MNYQLRIPQPYFHQQYQQSPPRINQRYSPQVPTKNTNYTSNNYPIFQHQKENSIMKNQESPIHTLIKKLQQPYSKSQLESRNNLQIQSNFCNLSPTIEKQRIHEIKRQRKNSHQVVYNPLSNKNLSTFTKSDCRSRSISRNQISTSIPFPPTKIIKFTYNQPNHEQYNTCQKRNVQLLYPMIQIRSRQNKSVTKSSAHENSHVKCSMARDALQQHHYNCKQSNIRKGDEQHHRSYRESKKPFDHKSVIKGSNVQAKKNHNNGLFLEQNHMTTINSSLNCEKTGQDEADRFFDMKFQAGNGQYKMERQCQKKCQSPKNQFFNLFPQFKDKRPQTKTIKDKCAQCIITTIRQSKKKKQTIIDRVKQIWNRFPKEQKQQFIVYGILAITVFLLILQLIQ